MLEDAKSIRPSPSLLLSVINTTVVNPEHLHVLLRPWEGSDQGLLWLISLLCSGEAWPALLQPQAVSCPIYNVPLTVCKLGNLVLWEYAWENNVLVQTVAEGERPLLELHGFAMGEGAHEELFAALIWLGLLHVKQ